MRRPSSLSPLRPALSVENFYKSGALKYASTPDCVIPSVLAEPRNVFWLKRLIRALLFLASTALVSSSYFFFLSFFLLLFDPPFETTHCFFHAAPAAVRCWHGPRSAEPRPWWCLCTQSPAAQCWPPGQSPSAGGTLCVVHSVEINLCLPPWPIPAPAAASTATATARSLHWRQRTSAHFGRRTSRSCDLDASGEPSSTFATAPCRPQPRLLTSSPCASTLA